ncbi:MAG: phosphoribosyltransferase [Vulcanococcus sp.]|jgi:hypoxanthine phosphoribosyltransferase
MRHLTWQDFDRAVDTIAASCQGAPLAGIHGIPRGGLVLAVALSHRLALPLLAEPVPGCLVVDDVYESGRTLAPHRNLERCRHAVWISKVAPQWWQAVEVTSSSEWLVFPWENPAAASADEALYRASRA